jgi:hypothetical protein
MSTDCSSVFGMASTLPATSTNVLELLAADRDTAFVARGQPP